MQTFPPFLSTGFTALDEVLGGGLPRARITEVFGPPGCGKTTLALHWIAAAQRKESSAVFVDAERSFHADWARACGVAVEELIVLNPGSAEQATAMMEELLGSYGVDLVVVDSAAALAAQDELDTTLEDAPGDAYEAALSRCLRRIQLLAQRSGAAVLFLNQLRQARTGEERSAGLQALSLHSSVRVRIERQGEASERQQLRLFTAKNKVCEPFRETWLTLCGAEVEQTPRKGPERQMRAAAGASRTA